MFFKYLASRPFYFNNQQLYFEVTVRRHASTHWPNPLDEPIVERVKPTLLMPQTSTDDRVLVKLTSPLVEQETLVTFAEPSLNIKPADLETKYKATLPAVIRRNERGLTHRRFNS